MRLVATLAILALLAPGQTQTPPVQPVDPSKPAEKAKLEGRVTNALTGEPLRRVNLTLRPAGSPTGASYSIVTDAEGKFLIEGIDSGSYILYAEKAGVARQSYGAKGSNVPPTPITLREGQHFKGLEFPVMPAAVITGKVIDDLDEPVQGAMVLLQRMGYVQGRRQLTPASNSSSNDQGSFRIANITPGSYFLTVIPRLTGLTSTPPPAKPGEPEMGLVATYYPNATDPSGAAPIRVTAGQELQGIDIKLRKTPVFRIKGRVNWPGPPPQNAAVTLMQGTSQMMMAAARAPIGEKGHFELAGTPAGQHTLMISAMIAGRGMSVRHQVTVGNENLEGVVVDVAGSLEIDGRIQMEGAPPEFKYSTLRIGLVSVESNIGGPTPPQVDEEGKFKLLNVPRDRFRVMLFEGLSSQGYLKSATFANRDILDEGLDLRSGGSGALEIVMSANTGEVSGTVRNEKGDPAPGSRVTLIPVKDRVGVANASRTGTSDQMGSFRLIRVPPGEYKIWAWEQLEFGLDQVPEFRRQFESSAVTVKVAEKGSESVALKMIATDAVERAKEKLP